MAFLRRFRGKILRGGLAALLTLSLAACVTTSFQTTTELKGGDEKHRIVLMPVDIQLTEIEASGMQVPKAEWTRKARDFVFLSLRNRFEAINAEIVLAEETATVSETDWREVQLVKLHAAVGNAIRTFQYEGPFKLPTKKGSFDWTLGPDAGHLEEKYDADYALFVHLRDSYVSGGRVGVIIVAAMFGVGLQGGIQTGFASLIDLQTGEVVWFNRLISGSGDLRTAEAADKSVTSLLENFPK